MNTSSWLLLGFLWLVTQIVLLVFFRLWFVVPVFLFLLSLGLALRNRPFR